MRPQRIAADNNVIKKTAAEVAAASMRPQRIAADNEWNALTYAGATVWLQ